MIRQGQIIAEAFDRVILYEDQYKRGRADGEIMQLLRTGLSAGPRVKEITDYQGASNAVEAALMPCAPATCCCCRPTSSRTRWSSFAITWQTIRP